MQEYTDGTFGPIRDKNELLKQNDISDGYHTFDELYDHRCLLFFDELYNHRCLLFLALALSPQCRKLTQQAQAYWVRDHIVGWDLAVVQFPEIGQISYQIPIRFRHLTSKLKECRANDHKYDGHTSAGVLKRLEEWCLS